MTRILRLLILGVLIPLVMVQRGIIRCPLGFLERRGTCFDDNECSEGERLCGSNAVCHNTIGSYYCQCEPGFRTPQQMVNFTAFTASCMDDNECSEDKLLCGSNAVCNNTIGSYYCQCEPGFRTRLQTVNFTAVTASCMDINECLENSLICGEGGVCINLIGSFECQCRTGFTSDGVKCVGLDAYTTRAPIDQTLADFENHLSLLRNYSLTLVGMGNQSRGEELVQNVVNVINAIQLSSSSVSFNSSEVNMFLISVEKTVSLIARHLRQNVTRITSSHTEVEIMVFRGRHPPRGPVRLNNENVGLDTTWETAIGDDVNYLGFGYVFLLSYKNLTTLFKTSDRPISTVATVSVSNPNRTELPQPVNITFTYLQSRDADPICAYWSETEQGSGAWSSRGCTTLMSNSTHMVCSCNHLSSFALIQGIHKGKPSVIIWAGASMAVACVVLSLLTTMWCRYVSKNKHGRPRQQPI